MNLVVVIATSLPFGKPSVFEQCEVVSGKGHRLMPTITMLHKPVAAQQPVPTTGPSDSKKS